MDTENLRIVVVPTETGNSIDQSSTVDEILECDEADIYTIGDYCKSQNDEVVCYGWTFLIDIKNRIDLTGIDI